MTEAGKMWISKRGKLILTHYVQSFKEGNCTEVKYHFEVVVCQPKKRVHEDITATFSQLATTINTPRVSYL